MLSFCTHITPTILHTKLRIMSYDLLNPTFKVQFRHYNGKPHFMIHPHEKDGVTYKNRTDEHLKHLVSAATSMVTNYTELQDDTILILSIHTDDFSEGSELHGHLCVESDTYLNVFHRMREKLQKKKKFPRDFDIVKHEDNVRKWSDGKNRTSYVQEDEKIIEKMNDAIQDTTDPDLPQKTKEHRIEAKKMLKQNHLFVFYHKEYPMIGFFIEASQEEEALPVPEYIKLLMQYKDKYLKEDPEVKKLEKVDEKKRGYHLCFRSEGSTFLYTIICVILDKTHILLHKYLGICSIQIFSL